MTDSPEKLAERLRSEGQKTLAFFSELPEPLWQLPLYSDGSRWTVEQLLAHFVASEFSIHKLIENILSGGPGSPENFDLNEYNERKVSRLKGVSHEQLFEQFKTGRELNVSLVAGMQPPDLERTGRHPFLGVARLEEIIKLLYRHNQIHQRDVRKLSY